MSEQSIDLSKLTLDELALFKEKLASEFISASTTDKLAIKEFLPKIESQIEKQQQLEQEQQQLQTQQTETQQEQEQEQEDIEIQINIPEPNVPKRKNKSTANKELDPKTKFIKHFLDIFKSNLSPQNLFNKVVNFFDGDQEKAVKAVAMVTAFLIDSEYKQYFLQIVKENSQGFAE